MPVTFGTPVAVNMTSTTTIAFAMSGVVSGQPIMLMRYSWDTGGLNSITDTFATQYTYTILEHLAGSTSTDLVIATGGVGASGTITMNCNSNTQGGVAVACFGATTLPTASAVESHTQATATSTTASVSLTPLTGNEGIFAGFGGFVASGNPVSPWANATNITVTGTVQAGMVTYSNPPAAAQTASWTGASAAWMTVGAVVKAAQEYEPQRTKPKLVYLRKNR